MPNQNPTRAIADRNLLFGILALQMDFVSRDQLVAAMHAWVLDKTKGLGEILVEQQALAADRRQVLEALVREHLKQHDNDPKKSLAAVHAFAAVLQDLQQIAGPEFQAGLATVSTAGTADPAPGQSGRPSVGGPTSDGTRFRVLRPHAKGGLGEVFVARDEELGREVALKEIQARHADNDDSRSRFVLEAEVTGGLEHPGVVPVYGLGCYPDGRPFYAMRFIRGDSMQDAIKRLHGTVEPGQDSGTETLDQRQLLRRFFDVCNTLEYAHSRGVLHRDLKPHNIMLGKYGETLVVDWGLAKFLDRDEGAADGSGERSEGPLVRSPGKDSAATQMGSAMGTPAYMSPEQAAGRLDLLSPASDVYSLGATLYCLLTGKAPFRGRDAGGVMAKVQRGEFPPPRQVRPEVPKALEAVCLKAMARRPKDRYASALELGRDVERWLDDLPVTAWPEPWTVKTRRWVGRHRTAVTASAAALLVALLSLGVATAMLTSANEELAKSNQAEQRAKELALKREDDAKREAKEALHQKNLADKARDRAEQSRYSAQIGQAAAAYQGGDSPNASAVLDETRWDLRGWEYGFLRRQADGTPLTLKGHTNWVSSVSFSPDGSRLASASKDGTVKVWDARSGTQLLTLKGHTDWAYSVSFSPDGSRLASASNDGVKVWDARSGAELLTLKGHTEDVRSVSFSPDGSRLASASADKTVKVWDARSGAELLTLKGHTEGLYSVSFNSDGSRLASASLDKTVKVWDARSGVELFTLKGHAKGVLAVSFSPNGSRLASAGWETVRLWDARSGAELFTLKVPTNGGVVAVSFSPDGSRLASAGFDKTVKVWDVRSGVELFTLQGHTDWVQSVSFSPDGSRLASASSDKTVKLWHARSDAGLLSHKGPVVRSVSFSPDGSRLASASDDKTVKLWDARSGAELLSLKGHTEAVRSVSFSPDGSRLASASADKTVKVWDARSGAELLTLKGHTGQVLSVSFSPDGSRLGSASTDKTVKLWDVRSGVELFTLKGHTGQVLSVSFSPDGSRLGSAATGGTVKVWDARSGAELLTLKGHTGQVLSVSFSPDGSRLASASTDKTVKLWDVRSGVELFTLKGHTAIVSSVSFSPDGSRLASASGDNTLKLWDASSGAELLTLKGHTSGVGSVSFSPDGSRLASTSLWIAQPAMVWDARHENELPTFVHTTRISTISFTPDSRLLVARDVAGREVQWKLPAEKPLGRAPPPGKSGGGIISPDGRFEARLEGHRVRLLARSLLTAGYDPWAEAEANRQAHAPAWHLQMTQEAEQKKDWFAAAFHLSQLTRYRPWELSLHSRAAHLWVKAGQQQRAALHFAWTAWNDPAAKTTVQMWDVRGRAEPLTLRGHMNEVWSVSFSPDGSRLASASEDGTVKLWDTRSGADLRTLKGHIGIVASVSFSPDGSRLATASGDRTVKVWDARSGAELVTLKGHTERLRSVSFNSDGSRLASASEDKTVKVWDARSGAELLTLKGHTGVVLSVSFSPDGSRLASASWDHTVKVWDARSGAELFTLKGHTNRVDSVTFSPDGSRLASASYDGTVKLWDTRRGAELLTLRGHRSVVHSASFSSDGLRLASASADNTLKLWDASSGAELLTLKGHTRSVISVCFSPDGSCLASASADHTVRLWNAPAAHTTVPVKRFEAEALTVLAQEHCRADPQDMARWGSGWSQGRQLFCGAEKGGFVELGLTVPAAGSYRLRVLTTAAPDFAKVQAALDGKLLAPILDLYSESVRPAASWELGTHELSAGPHRLRFTAVGKNAASTAFCFGIDAIDLLSPK